MKEYNYQKRGIFYKTNEIKPERKTLFFIHGVSASSSAWNLYEEKFKNEYNVISIDLRGHGKSKKYKNYDDYKFDNFVEDIHELIVELKLNKVILISHSFATLLVLEFISKYQNLVESLILISPNYKVNNNIFTKVARPIIKSFAKINALIFFPNKNGHIDYSIYHNTGDWNLRRLMADIINTGLSIYLYCVVQSSNFNGEKILENINIPTLIIHGKKDSIFPIKWGLEINKRIKNSKMAVIENSDHILVLNNFPEVSTLIEDFIKSN